MVTRGKLISDIELRLTGGKPSDDLELERSQIGHWLDITRDELVKITLDDMIKKQNMVDTYYMISETCQLVSKEALDCVDDDDERFYITLTNTPMSLYKDMGIVKVITDEYELVYPSNIISIDMINDLPFSKPNENTLVYHRENNKVIIYGINDNSVSDPSFIIYYVPRYENSALTDDDEFIISDDLLAPLLDQVEEIGRRQMYGSAQDNDNNSIDDRD